MRRMDRTKRSALALTAILHILPILSYCFRKTEDPHVSDVALSGVSALDEGCVLVNQ